MCLFVRFCACVTLCVFVLQESQAIPLVSVSQILGEAHPRRLSRQASQTEDPAAEKTDAGAHIPWFIIYFLFMHRAFHRHGLYRNTILHYLFIVYSTFGMHVLLFSIKVLQICFYLKWIKVNRYMSSDIKEQVGHLAWEILQVRIWTFGIKPTEPIHFGWDRMP